MYRALLDTIEKFDFSTIPESRKDLLNSITEYIQGKISNHENVNLNFICTHNSRRSHLSQIWAQALAEYYRIPRVYCYSGGTEDTALFPKVIETLNHQGFLCSVMTNENNPIYAIKFAENALPVFGFSKHFDHFMNPKAQFAAVMTCSHADENCPIIFGAEKRFPLTFEDPKAFDQSPFQLEKYLERSIEIATEIAFVFANVKS